MSTKLIVFRRIIFENRDLDLVSLFISSQKDSTKLRTDITSFLYNLHGSNTPLREFKRLLYFADPADIIFDHMAIAFPPIEIDKWKGNSKSLN